MSESEQKSGIKCPQCGATVKVYRNPVPTVDIIIVSGTDVVLVERRNEPRGWALPGGFVDYGESLETAALREAREETGLVLENLAQFGAYSEPGRDPRHHTITFVFSATSNGVPCAGDDARQARLFPLEHLPENLCFDHGKILADFKQRRKKVD